MDLQDEALSKSYEKWGSGAGKRKNGLLEKVLIAFAYLRITILFGCSVSSLFGEFLFAAIALSFMAGLYIDACRKHGINGFKYDAPLGLLYYVYSGALLAISVIVNLVVYVKALA